MSDSELQDFLAALDVAGFRRDAVDCYTPITRLPAWAVVLLESASQELAYSLSRKSYFLEHFLTEAETFWSTGTDGVFRSCSWSEPIIEFLGDRLQATAISIQGKSFLVIRPVGEIEAPHHAILQHGREVRLRRDAEAKEFEKREVLVHCIVHDLANPLTGVTGALQMLETEPLGEHAQRLVRLAWDACTRQRTLINQILDVFSVEAEALDGRIDPQHAPNLLAVAAEAVEQMEVAFDRYGLAGTVHAPAGDPRPCRVLAERTRLGRVFANLLENAVRHAPKCSEISIWVTRTEEEVEVRVEDRGAGMAPEALPHLFEKLAPGKGGVRGKAGLGLYFCRITIERWGGQIGYRPAEGGGACFWFRLRLAEPA